MTMQNQWLVWLTNELIVVYIYFTMIQKRQKKEEQMKQTKKCECNELIGNHVMIESFMIGPLMNKNIYEMIESKKKNFISHNLQMKLKNLTFDCVNHSINECIELSYLS